MLILMLLIVNTFPMGTKTPLCIHNTKQTSRLQYIFTYDYSYPESLPHPKVLYVTLKVESLTCLMFWKVLGVLYFSKSLWKTLN